MRTQSIKIEVGGRIYDKFLSCKVEKRLDSLCKTFSFESSYDSNFDFTVNDSCRIYVNNQLIVNGYIEKWSPSSSVEDNTISIEGRCILGDIIDSSIPNSIHIQNGITLEDIIKKIVIGLGLKIKVINLVKSLKPFSSSELVSAEPDSNCWDFITEYANKRSVVITSDNYSNIIICRAGTARVKDKLLNLKDDSKLQNNILSATASYDYSQRFYKYVVISQENKLADKASFNVSSVGIKGIAYDNEIRKSRILTIKSDVSSDSASCKEMANFEANIRRANSLNYQCEIAGFALNNGNIWNTNELVHVVDDENFINSELLIKSVDFNYNNDRSTTSFELAPRDAFSLKAEMDELESRHNSIADKAMKKQKHKAHARLVKHSKKTKKQSVVLSSEQLELYKKIHAENEAN